ncbi:MAG: metallophosphoesterase family protein [Calditrichaeota bacterium]|nr:metallophosphoesterase family protein [Calditrichota bacterium]
MQVGLISDTHGTLPAEVFKLFSGVDLILHAGDIGKEDIIIELSAVAPVRAVFGNTDHFPLVSHYKRIDFFKLGHFNACLNHIIGTPKSFAFQLFKMNKKVDVVIYGHTHKAGQTRFNQILFVNPGSASQPRYGQLRSVAILNVEQTNIEIEFKYF